MPHRLGVLLVGPAGRFLRGQAPAPQVAAHRPDRESQAEALLNQGGHRLTGPQERGEAKLVWTVAFDKGHDGRLLVPAELGRWWATLGPLVQRCFAALAVLAHPPSYRAASHSKGTSCGGLLHPAQDGPHRPLAQGFLSFWRKGAGVLHLHYPAPLPNLLGTLWIDKISLSSIYRSE